MTTDNTVAGTTVAQEANAENLTESDKKWLTINYILFALGFLTVVTFIAGAVVAYLKKGEAESALAVDHYRWQLRTFWYSALWSVLGVILSVVIIGYFVLLANAIWVIWRITLGFVRLSSEKKVYS